MFKSTNVLLTLVPKKRSGDHQSHCLATVMSVQTVVSESLATGTTKNLSRTHCNQLGEPMYCKLWQKLINVAKQILDKLQCGFFCSEILFFRSLIFGFQQLPLQCPGFESGQGTLLHIVYLFISVIYCGQRANYGRAHRKLF